MSNNKKKNIYIVRFFRFLKENGLFGRYLKYYKINKLNEKRPLYKFLNGYDPFVYISNAFSWDETEEGFDFWEEKHSEWVRTYEKKNPYNITSVKK